MGGSYAALRLTNRLRGDSVLVNALVDTGAMFLCVPESVSAQLGFDVEEVRRSLVTLADGRTIEVPVIDPVLIQFENRSYSTEAMVLGDETLIGVIPMEAMDVVIEPRTQTMVVNPAHPNYAVSVVKDAR